MSNTDFTVTRDQIVRTALRRIGVSDPSTTEVSQAVTALNSIVRVIDQAGRWLWAITPTESTITTVGGQSAYNAEDDDLRPDIIRLESVSILRGTSRTEIDILDKSSFIKSPYRESSGDPAIVHLQKESRLVNQTLVLYPVPTAGISIVYTYQRALHEFDAASDNPDMPAEWVIPLEDQLASRLSMEYGATTDQQLLLANTAKESLAQAKTANGEPQAVMPAMRSLYY